MTKHIKYIERFDLIILKNTVYIPLKYNDSRSILNAFYINVGFSPRVNMRALQRHNIYKNLKVLLFESDIKYIFPLLADSSIKSKYQIKIKTNIKD